MVFMLVSLLIETLYPVSPHHINDSAQSGIFHNQPSVIRLNSNHPFHGKKVAGYGTILNAMSIKSQNINPGK